MSNTSEILLRKRDELKEKWNGLTPRDQVLLVAFVIFIIIAAVGFKFWLLNKSIAAMAAESEQYRKSLNYIAENQALYQKNKDENEAIRDRLLKADAKISNKLTSMGSALGIDVNYSPKDPKKLDSGVEETEIELQIKNADYSKLLEYLVQIHKLDTTIYMRHINMTRTSNNSSADTKMTATITLIFYRLKEPNAT